MPDNERARIEFHFHQLSDCLGIERFKLPVLGLKELRHNDSRQSNDQIVRFLGKHLAHDVGGLRVAVEPQELEKCGGGG